jgi:glucosamine kinase
MTEGSAVHKPLYIGVDGGGTGCRARIEASDGRVLGEGRAGPATLRLGAERSMEMIVAACQGAVADAGLRLAMLGEMDAVVGLAGVGRKGALEGIAALSHPFRSVTYLSDATIACIGAHSGREGGIVIIGTGSVALAVIGGREIRAGGYGFPISDDGSGADLGLHAIRLALRAYDGRTTETAFTRDVMARFQHDPIEVIAWVDQATATDYATLAPLVIRHAEAEDPVAQRIVGVGAAHINDMVRLLIARGAPRISLLGGLAHAMEPWLAQDVQRHLAPAEGDALDGAMHVARTRRR